MPAKKQGDTFVLKHRLAGAAVLIGFAVIVLPLLLGGPQEQPAGGSDGGAASGESGAETKVFRSNITPIGGATPSVQSSDSELEQTVGELLDPGDAAGSEPQAADAGVDEETATDAPAETSEPEESSDDGRVASSDQADDDSETGEQRSAGEVDRGWIVQVGTFRKRSNVEKLVADLENNGYKTSTAEVQTSGGSATRVWVGPYGTRVEAARIKNRVVEHTGGEGLIVAYP